jgi:methionyl-tRNA formyltransferase
MRIVFFGTPEFAATSLSILISNGKKVVGVVTACDQFGGRGGKILLESPVKKVAEAHHIKILQPKSLKNKEFIAELISLKADVFIIVAFRMLPEVVWSIPPMGSYNLHGSLLPKYRGAAPIHWAVINGETETGVTVFKLKHEIDTGDILMKESMPIFDNDTTGSVHDRMMVLGADVLLKAMDKIQNHAEFIVQNEKEVSHAPKIFHDDCRINFHVQAKKVYDFIRGMSPYPGAWMTLDGTECKILSVFYSLEKNTHPGQIETDGKKYLYIHTIDGKIEVQTIKMAGKKLMSIKEFLSGYRIQNLFVGD